MKIRRSTYHIQTNKDKTQFFIAGSGVTVVSLINDRLEELARYNDMSDTDEVAVSEDMDIFAYKNTSGRIKVRETATGQLILNTPGLKDEGSGFFILPGNNSILASTWGGDIAAININSGKIENCTNIELPGTMDMYSWEDQYYVLSNRLDPCVSKLFSFDPSSFSTKELFETSLYIKKMFPTRDSVFMYIKNFKDLDDCILVYDKKTNEVSPLNISNLYYYRTVLGYLTDLYVDTQVNRMIISYTDGYLVVDITTGEILYKKKEKYLNRAVLLSNNYVALGTATQFLIKELKSGSDDVKCFLKTPK